MIGQSELIIIVLIVFILFGSSAIPKFAKSIGQAKKEFEKGMSDGVNGDTKDDNSSKSKKAPVKKKRKATRVSK